MADFDIGSILNSLSNEDIENIKTMAGELLSSPPAASNQNTTSSSPSQTLPEKSDITEKNNSALPDLSALSSLNMPDLSQISSLLPLLNAFNSRDSRIDFIEALKPLLTEGKRKKADEAMKLIRLMSIIPLLRERGLM